MALLPALAAILVVATVGGGIAIAKSSSPPPVLSSAPPPSPAASSMSPTRKDGGGGGAGAAAGSDGGSGAGASATGGGGGKFVKNADGTWGLAQITLPPNGSPIPGVVKRGAVVGTNKAGLVYGDLEPYSRCKIKYRGQWSKQKGQMVGKDYGYTDGQLWSVMSPNMYVDGANDMLNTSFLSDYAGPRESDNGWANFLELYRRPQNVAKYEFMLKNGVELPPWQRSGDLAHYGVIKRICR